MIDTSPVTTAIAAMIRSGTTEQQLLFRIASTKYARTRARGR